MGGWFRPIGRPLTLLAAAVFVVAGVGVAAVSLHGSTQSAGGQYVSYVGSVPGVVAQGVLISTIPVLPPFGASTNPSALTVLNLGGANQTSTYCANPCGPGNFAQEVQYLVTGQPSAEGFELSINAGSGSTVVTTTLYFQVPAPVGGNATTQLGVFVDLSSSSSVTSFTAAIQLCSSPTMCP